MSKTQNPKQYNLGERTENFAKRVRDYIKNAPKDLANIEDAKQVIKASGSVIAVQIRLSHVIPSLRSGRCLRSHAESVATKNLSFRDSSPLRGSE